MSWTSCERCNGSGYAKVGFWRALLLLFTGTIPKCNRCGGDGHAKPPGWPDPGLMNELRGPVPPPPPPKRNGFPCPVCGQPKSSKHEVGICNRCTVETLRQAQQIIAARKNPPEYVI